MPLLASLTLLLSLPLVRPSPQVAAMAPSIEWIQNGGADAVERAMQRALSEERPLVVFLRPGADEPASPALDRALGSIAGAGVLGAALCLDLRGDERLSAELRARHELGERARAVCLSPEGDRLDALGTAATPDAFVFGLQRMLAGRETLRVLEERWRTCKPESQAGLELCAALLERMEEAGEPVRAAPLREHLRSHDAKGVTRAGAMLQLAEIEERLRAESAGADAMSMSMPDRTPLQTMARKAKFPEVRCAAWRSLAEDLRAGGDRGGALDCDREALAAAPEEQRETLGPELVRRWLAEGAKLDSAQQKKLLVLAEAVVDSGEELAGDASAWRARHPVSSAPAFLAERQRLLAEVLRLCGKEKQAQAAEARADELEAPPGARRSRR